MLKGNSSMSQISSTNMAHKFCSVFAVLQKLV